VKIEQDLMKIVPKDDWLTISHRLIQHGRKVCNARKPICGSCVLAPDCPYFLKLSGKPLPSSPKLSTISNFPRT
jgi:endonuclease-3